MLLILLRAFLFRDKVNLLLKLFFFTTNGIVVAKAVNNAAVLAARIIAAFPAVGTALASCLMLDLKLLVLKIKLSS